MFLKTLADLLGKHGHWYLTPTPILIQCAHMCEQVCVCVCVCVCTCVHVHMCFLDVLDVCRVPKQPEEGVTSFGAEVTNELPTWVLGSDL